MRACITNKKSYPSREIAEEALIEAHSQYHFGLREGPVAIYLCDECGAYHLTSKGVMSERLKQYLADGKISLQKEANFWIKKK